MDAWDVTESLAFIAFQIQTSEKRKTRLRNHKPHDTSPFRQQWNLLDRSWLLWYATKLIPGSKAVLSDQIVVLIIVFRGRWPSAPRSIWTGSGQNAKQG